MQNAKKKSFLVAVVCLILCVALLVGTTFAWFTDSVSNTGNKIQAGTLDVELWQTAASLNDAQKADSSIKTTSDSNYRNISGSLTAVYGYDKWEPGYSAPAGFKIYNAGNLAVKYELSFKLTSSLTGLENTSSAAYDQEHLTKCNANSYLENVLKVYKASSKEECTDANYLGTLSQFFDQTVSYSGYILAGQTSEAIDLVVVMPESAGNEYENAAINFDIDLRAMQYTYEEDGFGSNQYDAQADGNPDHTDWELTKKMTQQTQTVAEGQPTVFTLGNTIADTSGLSTVVTVPESVKDFTPDSESVIEVQTTPIIAANNLFTVTSDEGAVGAIDLTVKVDGTEVSEFKDSSNNPVPVTVETYVAKGLSLDGTNEIGIEYSGTGEQPVFVSYDSETGKLVFTTTHFSTFLIAADQVAYDTNNNTAYLTVNNALAAMSTEESDTVTLLKDTAISSAVSGVPSTDFVLDFNGKTITSGKQVTFSNSNAVSMTMKNGTYQQAGGNSGRIGFSKDCTVLIDNMTFKSTDSNVCTAITTNTNGGTNVYTITNSTFNNALMEFNGGSKSANPNDSITIRNCSITADTGNNMGLVKVGTYTCGTVDVSDTVMTYSTSNAYGARYCIYADNYLDYTGYRKLNINLTDVTLNTNGFAVPYGYRFMTYNNYQEYGENATVTLNGTNVFTHDGVNVVEVVKAASATNKSIDWAENKEAYEEAHTEWFTYANANPKCSSYTSSRDFLAECNGYYFVVKGTSLQPVLGNCTITKNAEGKVTQVKYNSGYYTYNTIGTTDVSVELGDKDNTNVKIYTLNY